MKLKLRIKTQTVLNGRVFKTQFCVQVNNGGWSTVIFEDKKMMFDDRPEAEKWLLKIEQWLSEKEGA